MMCAVSKDRVLPLDHATWQPHHLTVEIRPTFGPILGLSVISLRPCEACHFKSNREEKALAGAPSSIVFHPPFPPSTYLSFFSSHTAASPKLDPPRAPSSSLERPSVTLMFPNPSKRFRRLLKSGGLGGSAIRPLSAHIAALICSKAYGLRRGDAIEPDRPLFGLQWAERIRFFVLGFSKLWKEGLSCRGDCERTIVNRESAAHSGMPLSFVVVSLFDSTPQILGGSARMTQSACPAEGHTFYAPNKSAHVSNCIEQRTVCGTAFPFSSLQARFAAENEARVAANVRAAYAEVAASTWLGMHLQMMATIVITFIALVAVVQKHVTTVPAFESRLNPSQNPMFAALSRPFWALFTQTLRRTGHRVFLMFGLGEAYRGHLQSSSTLGWGNLFSLFTTVFGRPFRSATWQRLTSAGVGSAGLVGLGLSYALPIVELLNGLLATFTETEKEMVAVERVQQVILSSHILLTYNDIRLHL